MGGKSFGALRARRLILLARAERGKRQEETERLRDNRCARPSREIRRDWEIARRAWRSRGDLGDHTSVALVDESLVEGALVHLGLSTRKRL
eukprot:3998136-Pleurochrysis_carterae.AAC.1